VTITIPALGPFTTPGPDITDTATFEGRVQTLVDELMDFPAELNVVTAAIKTQVEAEVASVSGALGRVGYTELLRTISISGGPSTIDFVHGTGGVVISNAYDVYEIELVNVVLSSSSSTLLMRTSTNLGSTWDSGSTDYGFHVSFNGPTGSSSTSSVSASEIRLTGAQSANNTPVTGSIKVYAPSSATACYLLFELANSGNGGVPTRNVGAGARLAASDVDAIRLFVGSGTFVSGTVNLYGRRK
jgi:hypothetical protein